MNLSTLSCAQAIRDGGIDAMAALNDALVIALDGVPESSHQEIKRAIGRALGAIMDETINPAIAAYPDLKPSQEVWLNVVKNRAQARADSFVSDA